MLHSVNRRIRYLLSTLPPYSFSHWEGGGEDIKKERLVPLFDASILLAAHFACFAFVNAAGKLKGGASQAPLFLLERLVFTLTLSTAGEQTVNHYPTNQDNPAN